jgi:regulator of RNase E activity RraA
VDSILLAQLKALDTCTVANAVEQLDDRLRNEGFTDRSVRRITSNPAPLVGHAVTVRIRCSRPPMQAKTYIDRTDWWSFILAVPPPRIVVVQDVDDHPGLGTFLGEVHSAILMALGCVGGITNGAVRDVPAVEKSGFQLFAGGLAVSHAYAHIVEYDVPVEVGGLTITPGDLLHADEHGVLSVPLHIAQQVPAKAQELRQKERAILDLCKSPDFSLEKLRRAVAGP